MKSNKASLYYYNQYKDLYKDCQKNGGKYKAFVFDVKNSKIMFSNNRSLVLKVIEFVNKTTRDLLDLEKKLGRKILHRHLESSQLDPERQVVDKVVLMTTLNDYTPKGSFLRSDQLNPLMFLGDAIHFIIESDSLSDENFMKIFQRNKDAMIPEVDFHFASGFYDTDVWAESGQKFSRIYCLPILNELSKINNKLITTKKSAYQSEK